MERELLTALTGWNKEEAGGAAASPKSPSGSGERPLGLPSTGGSHQVGIFSPESEGPGLEPCGRG